MPSTKRTAQRSAKTTAKTTKRATKKSAKTPSNRTKTDDIEKAIMKAEEALKPYFDLRTEDRPSAKNALGFLEPAFGAKVDGLVSKRDQYVIGWVHEPKTEPDCWSFHSREAIWDASTGGLGLLVPGAVGMDWSPDGTQVGVWRELGEPQTSKSGKTILRSTFTFERYRFPSGERIGSVELVEMEGIDPVQVKFVQKYKGKLVRLIGGECGGAVTIHLLCDDQAGDRVVGGDELRAFKGKPAPEVTPEKEANDEETAPARLRELAAHSVKVARLVARHPATPAALLAELAASKDSATRSNVALHHGVAMEVLLQLARDRDARVRQSAAVALGRHTAGVPLEIYETLARDKNENVRYYLTQGKHTPDSVLRLLSDDPAESVRHHLTTRASPELLEKMLTDPSPMIRGWILNYYHAKLPYETIAPLRADADQRVRDAADRALQKKKAARDSTL